MNSKPASVSPRDVRSLACRFDFYRSSSGKSHSYPLELRQGAVALLASGVPAEGLAKALKVSLNALYTWRRELRPAPRRLVVVELLTPTSAAEKRAERPLPHFQQVRQMEKN